MLKEDLQKYSLPDQPGVYIFRNAKKKRIYIGKATSLKSRVGSYFSKGLLKSRGPLLVKMLEEARSIEWEETDSVLEALILEANLIKKHQPIYNTKEKSNKSFNYLVITNEAYPRLLVVRGRDLLTKKEYEIKTIFGPFPQGTALKEALKVVRKIFPYRDKCSVESNASKPCFAAQIGLCPGVCTGAISAAEYRKVVRHITLLFEGKKQALIKALYTEMQKAAKAERFEDAARVRNQVFSLEHIRDIAIMEGGEQGKTLRRIEAYDAAHMSEQNRVGVMVVLEDGEPAKGEYKRFKIKTDEQGDIAALKELLTRRLAHDDWDLPSLIVVDGGKAQVNAARRVLQAHSMTIPVIGVVKDTKHNPKAILGDKGIGALHEKEILLINNESHRFAIAYHKQMRNKNLLL
jgi:excinuclease ABC subunit C